MATTDQALAELTERGFHVTLTIGQFSSVISWAHVDYGVWASTYGRLVARRRGSPGATNAMIGEELHHLTQHACTAARERMEEAGVDMGHHPWRAG